MGRNKYTDPQSDKYRESEALEHSALKWLSPSNPALQVSGNSVKKVSERV